MPSRKTVPLPGSEHKSITGHRVKGAISGDQPIEVRITLKAPVSLEQKAQELARQPLSERQYVSRADFEKAFSASNETIQKLEQFARDHNLTVSRIEPAQNTVYLSGNARDM